MSFRTFLLTIGILFLSSYELLSQEQPGLENGRYKMKVKSSGISTASELTIQDNRYTILTDRGGRSTGEIIWADPSFFTLIGDGTDQSTETEEDGIAKLSEPLIEPNSSYSLRNPGRRTTEFTIHPRGNLHIIRGTGKLIKLKD